MSKGSCMYSVYVYVGGLSSHDVKKIYTTSKQSDAEKFLHAYTKKHEEVCKAYIERSFGRSDLRKAKRMREEDDD